MQLGQERLSATLRFLERNYKHSKFSTAVSPQFLSKMILEVCFTI